MDGDKLFEFTTALRREGKKDLAKDAERLANVFRDYIIPIVPLVTDNLDVVTDAFVRINSQGKVMSEAHMLRALTHLKAIDTSRHFEEIRASLDEHGWGDLDDQVLVNALKAQLGFDVYASSVQSVQDALLADPTALLRLSGAVKETVTFLEEIGVCGPGALPYAYQLVTLTALAAREPGVFHETKERERLRAWFWFTTYSEHFTGITGNRIRDGIQEMIGALAGGKSLTPSDPPLVRPLTEVRSGSVRAKAFQLFLAQLPTNEDARRRRQERLGTADSGAARGIFPTLSSMAPGNRVIASPAELSSLRKAIKQGSLEPQLADEMCIPPEAAGVLPDSAGFVDVRGRFLTETEKDFIKGLGLRIVEPE